MSNILNFLRNRKNNFCVVFRKYKQNLFEYKGNVFRDHIETFNDLTNWEIGHPVNGIGNELYNNSHQITDVSNIYLQKPYSHSLDSTQCLSLGVSKKKVDLENGKTITKCNSSIFKKEPLSYGIYKWSISFPTGQYINPYISLINKDTFPPEIKVISGYSNSKHEYFSIGSEVLYGYNKENIKSVGYLEHKRTIYNEFNKFEVKLDWTKDYIRIYYNGYLVNEVTSKKALRYYNMNPKMYVVIGCDNINNRQNRISSRNHWFNIYDFTYYKVHN